MIRPLNHYKSKVAAIIPAYNESKVIAACLIAIRHLIPATDIYVVDDGSKDNTFKIAKKYTKNVLSITNSGKAEAINTAIKYFKLTRKYEYIFFMDADTQPRADFLDQVFKHFRSDTDNSVVCVVGRVKGLAANWISKYRQWEYQISHFIHKRAQSIIGSILVVPGCATVYKSKLFDKIKVPNGTLTEDMDFTFLLHRCGYNNIVFESKAIVYTQDPQNIRDFVKQISRWYTGFWQVVRKHEIPWHGQILDFEVALLGIEGLYNGTIVIFFLLSLLPLSIMGNLYVYRLPILIDFFIFFLPTLIWSILADRDFSRLVLIPHFYFLRFLSSLIFFASFFNAFLSYEKKYVWNSNRYKVVKGDV